MVLREGIQSDIPFLEEMLYEAVFWRNISNRPSFGDALLLPEVSKALADWGTRKGDTAVIAEADSAPVGAAWYRYWTKNDNVRGYIDENIPVLAIGVRSDCRHQGVGKRMIGWMLEYLAKHDIDKISLMVSKDNYAINLYRQQGFVEYADRGDSIIMMREI